MSFIFIIFIIIQFNPIHQLYPWHSFVPPPPTETTTNTKHPQLILKNRLAVAHTEHTAGAKRVANAQDAVQAARDKEMDAQVCDFF